MTIRRSNSQLCGKVGGEPLFYNPFIKSKLLDSFTLQLYNRFFANPPLTKLPGLRLKGQRKSAARLSQETGIQSQRLLTNILQEVVN